MRTYETYDWAQIAKGPKPLDEGLYKARVTSAKPTPTKAEGKPMLTLELEIFQNAEGGPVKRKLKDYLLLSQESAFRVLILSKALDIDPLPNNSDEAQQDFCTEIVNAAKEGVFVRIKHETSTDRRTGEDRTDMRVARYLNESEVGGDSSADEPPPRRSRSNGASAEA